MYVYSTNSNAAIVISANVSIRWRILWRFDIHGGTTLALLQVHIVIVFFLLRVTLSLENPLVFSIHTKWGSASFICNAVVFYKGFIIEIIDLIWGYFSNCVSIIAVPISSSTIFNTCICSFTCTLLPHIQAVCFIKSCSN